MSDTSASVLLTVRDVRKSFGNHEVLRGVTTSIGANEVRAVIGPNGAGKTTFINVVTGIYAPTSGRVSLAGRDISRAAPHSIVREGMARTYQIASLYPSLTVAENIVVACRAASKFSKARMTDAISPREYRDRMLELFNLTRLAGRQVAEISHGDQRLVELAVTASLRPRLMLLDEPTAGMSPAETQQFIELINTRLRSSCAIMLVEHDMKVVMGTADTITVLANGAVLAEGGPDSIRNNAKVQEAYLGSAFAH
ncbi:ABC transporter ATP-binding protein [Bradyrhizobium canariense]|uniref:Branched-chain amino acid transport system ATP-binding protein n=1 Tax=Bradyrhizobium canariense TaxID=255045 RepID=A0A1H1VFX7_9BRAD|nr:ABC transporter ATP-binding protein [Bradyrhizobium canariense]SDS83585.1 branched-chain amino acid transport system ATP-binding protein [Bradyrhizobium canariense]